MFYFIQTQPSIYTEEVGTLKPEYRILYVTVRTEAGVESVNVNDFLRIEDYANNLRYIYRIIATDTYYIYLSDRQVINTEPNNYEVDWTAGMSQTYEYYVVDPGTWKETSKLDNVKSCSITRDADTDTLASASIEIDGTVGEAYIRVYLIVNQNGYHSKECLGTFLVQTPSSTFDGKATSITMDCYSSLLELSENSPDLGYTIMSGTTSSILGIEDESNIMKRAYDIVSDHVRAPVVITSSDKVLDSDFVANTDDTWLTFTSDLIANAKMKFDIDEYGRILFAPKQDTAALQPVWTYDDGNSSILLPSITMDHDLYGIPNVVEVIYSQDDALIYSIVKNEDENSPVSIPSRGREILYRSTNPSFAGSPTQEEIDEYAKTLLKELSTLEYTVTYSHGYCPVRVGDCVRLNYTRSGITDIKAKVTKQTIKCEPGCEVSETAVFTNKLWEG